MALLLVGVTLTWTTRAGTRWPGIYYMTGPSMEPTVRAGEYFLVWNPPGHLARGDLVVFRYEDGDGVFHVLRRLAGLPGDRSLLAGTEDLYTWGPWTVPPDSVVLLSDTRDMLGWPDSRFLGFIPRTDIVGKATRTLRGRALRD
ncbi:MAG: hypothetical protein HYW52_03560 [Gemmatimonadetes bacterium]|nr:hypothetical protein [Gemmatimonadota bacterium]